MNPTTDTLPLATPSAPDKPAVPAWPPGESAYLTDSQRRENARLYATSPTSSAAPGDSPFYNRVFWASYKGLSRGLLGGLLLGAGLGAVVGGVVVGGLALAGLAASATVASVLVGATTLLGMKYYKDVFSIVGANTGAISAAMEINEERSDVINQKLDKLLELEVRRARLDPKELENLQKDATLVRHRGLQYFEDKFDSTPAVFWKLAGVGALVGAIFGGVILWGGGHNFLVDAVQHLFSPEALAQTGMSTEALTSVLGGGLVAASSLGGASFGINRHYFRQHFNVTNALYEGDLKYVGKQRAQEKQNIVEICEQPGRGVGSCELLEHPVQERVMADAPGTRVAQARSEGALRTSVMAAQTAL
jgi:hypothetical protein